MYSIKNLKHTLTNYTEEPDYEFKASSAFKYALKNSKVNLRNYQIKISNRRIWQFSFTERFDYLKLKSLQNQQNSEQDVCSRRSTIDFNDLDDDDDEENCEIQKQNPFLLGTENQDYEFLDGNDECPGELVVSEEVPQAQIVSCEKGIRKFINQGEVKIVHS